MPQHDKRDCGLCLARPVCAPHVAPGDDDCTIYHRRMFGALTALYEFAERNATEIKKTLEAKRGLGRY